MLATYYLLALTWSCRIYWVYFTINGSSLYSNFPRWVTVTYVVETHSIVPSGQCCIILMKGSCRLFELVCRLRKRWSMFLNDFSRQKNMENIGSSKWVVSFSWSCLWALSPPSSVSTLATKRSPHRNWRSNGWAQRGLITRNSNLFIVGRFSRSHSVRLCADSVISREPFAGHEGFQGGLAIITLVKISTLVFRLMSVNFWVCLVCAAATLSSITFRRESATVKATLVFS